MNGTKQDAGKPRWSLIPPDTLNEVIAVLEHGAAKYGEHNWLEVPNAEERYYNALMRHVQQWWHGEPVDAETERHHLAHAICCCLFLIWMDMHHAHQP